MAAGIARAPQTDAVDVAAVDRFKKTNHAPPIGDLPPRIDVAAGNAAARPEAAVIMDNDDEARLGEALGEAAQPSILQSGEPVRHGDRRPRARSAVRTKEPGVESDRVG